MKIKQATVAFQVRGTGQPTNRTFALGNEDHTLGNAVRHVLMQDKRVRFAGYSVPHPSEPVVHVRVQTDPDSDCTAIEALKDSCATLDSQCNEVLERLEDLLPEVKEDRLREEQRVLDELIADPKGKDSNQGEADDEDIDEAVEPMDQD